MQINRLAALLAPFALAMTASADVIDFSASVPMTDTPWMVGLNVPKFDPSLGTLTKVTWVFGGTLKADMRFESLDGAPTTVTMQTKGTLQLLLADMTPVLTLNPQLDTSDNVSEYDTVPDFGGASGRSYMGLMQSSSDSGFAIDQATLDAVTGLGNLGLLASAQASTAATAAGNLLTIFTAQASADLRVRYEYTPVPTPGAMALMGVTGLVATRRRR